MKGVEEFVEKLKEFDSQSRGDSTVDVVAECIQTPLHWLKEEMTPTQQLSFVSDSAWQRHVWHVFQNLVPRWSFSIAIQSLQSTCALDNSQAASAMAKVSLPILIECLAQPDFSTNTIYTQCLKSLTMSSSLFALYAQQLSKNDIPMFCSLVCSVPSHLANAWGLQLEQVRFNNEHEWYIERNFYAKLSQFVVENLTKNSIEFVKEFIGKMIRQGHEESVMRSIYQSDLTLPDWPNVFEKVEKMTSTDQVILSLLRCLKGEIERREIHWVAHDIYPLVGQDPDRIRSFLEIGLFKAGKMSWADERLARVVVSAVVYAVQPDLSVLIESVKGLIRHWSDRVFIQFSSSRERFYLTASILSVLAYLKDEDIKSNIMIETSIVRSVSDYFDSGDVYTAQLGAVMAESLSSRVDKDKPLKTGLLDSNEKLNELKQSIFIQDAYNQSKEQKEQKEVLSESESDIEEDGLDPDALFSIEESCDESESEDEDLQAYHMDDESEDEGMKKESSAKNQTKTPVFIRDLIRCLQDHNDPLKLELGLNSAEKTIRQKFGAGTELSELCIPLATYLIGFPETFEIENFRQLQQASITALIVGVPEKVTGFVIDQLYDRNTSLGQKQMILASISLAVRELAGWSENILPVDNEDMIKKLENVQIGKSLFKSKRMEVERRQQQKIRKNKLSGLAGSVFFFPLLVGWWEGAQGRIKYWLGNQTQLTERFIMTLNIILHSSTNTLDKRKIVREYFEFCLSMRYFKQNSIGIKKALLLGIDTILNVSYKDQESLLFSDYYRELSEVKSWLEDLMENQAEQQLQEITVNILIRLSKIALSSHST